MYTAYYLIKFVLCNIKNGILFLLELSITHLSLANFGKTCHIDNARFICCCCYGSSLFLRNVVFMLCLPFLFTFFGPLHFGFINTHTLHSPLPTCASDPYHLVATPLYHALSWSRYCTTSSPWMTTHVPNPYDMAWHPQPPLEYEDPLHPPVFYPTYGPMDYQVWALSKFQVYSYFQKKY